MTSYTAETSCDTSDISCDPQPHIISTNPLGGSEDSKHTKAKGRTRKSVKNTSVSGKKTLKKSTEEDQKVIDLRNELKLLTLKSAEMKGLSDADLKISLAKIAKMKENDLSFELEKLRVQLSSSWTKNLSKALTDAYGFVADLALRTEGYIQQEVREDKNLEASVHGELEKVAFDMNPKARIAMLLAVDTAKGYFAKKAGQKFLQDRLPILTFPNPLPGGPPVLIRQNAIIPVSHVPQQGETHPSNKINTQ